MKKGTEILLHLKNVGTGDLGINLSLVFLSFQEASALSLPLFKEDFISINNLGNQTSLMVVREI